MSPSDPLSRAGAMTRGPLTWYAYLLVGFFTYLLNIQGNILPFLQTELALSYRAASLHFSALAAGMIVVGLFGDRITRRLGRRKSLWLATASVGTGALLLCVAQTAATSIASCFLLGFPGALIPAIAFALIGEDQGPHADVAFGEVSALSYMFGIVGPLAISACLLAGVNWRGALILGAAIGAVLFAAFRATPVTDSTPPQKQSTAALPAAYWAFWGVMAFSVALEFSVLFWAPAFLERVAGLSATAAAASAAVFSVAMICGRMATSVLVRRVPAAPLLAGSLLITVAGFLLYWGLAQPAPAIAGLFLLGFGTAPLYPLTMGLALAVAGPQAAAASARFMLAVGISILSMPTLLGALADAFGLSAAHLMLPGLALLAGAFLAGGLAIQRRNTLTGA